MKLRKFLVSFLTIALLITLVFPSSLATAQEATNQELNQSETYEEISEIGQGQEEIYEENITDNEDDSEEDFIENEIDNKSANTSDGTLVVFDAEDIDQHPDVKQYIIEAGLHADVSSFADQKNVEEIYKALPHLSKEEIDKVRRDFGFDQPTPMITAPSNVEGTYVVERSRTGVEIDNIWLLTYDVSDTIFSIFISPLKGTDNIDLISGKIVKKNKRGKDWYSASSIRFNKKQHPNKGLVFAWSVPKTAVSDYFDYEITIQEDVSIWRADNIGKKNYQRYFFETGIYNKMKALGGERHHVVSQDALRGAGFNPNHAPTIRMLLDDHYLTPNWGKLQTSKDYRAVELQLINDKKYFELLKMEVDSFRTLPDPEGKHSSLHSKYEVYLIDAITQYYRYFGV